MKTSQILTRKMGDFDVLQRTSDGMFNATSLLRQWNEYSGMKKEVKDFFDNKSTQEFINVLNNRENLNGGNSPYLTTRGKNGGTWMHPYLFIDFAMWLNPEFKYNVIKFVHDQLIEYRNEAGNSFKELSSAVYQIVGKDEMTKAMSSIATAINYVVYNHHERQLRNKQADELRLKEVCELQKDLSKLINFGFINTYDQLRNFLKKRWSDKWQQNILSA